MTSFLLDTNFCIHFIRGRAWARSALARVQVLDVAISAVTVGELHEGAHRANFPTKEMAKTEVFLKPFEVIPLGREEAMEWGLIEARLRKEGNPIEAEDSMIAATAHKHGLTLVTGNIKHFARVKGLKVVDWEQHPPKA
jgi:predicted nucleic acid-binding protein